MHLVLLLSLGTLPLEHPYGEYAGLRSMAMGGAHRGLGTSNDALLLNPAGMADGQRYSMDLAYGRDAGREVNTLGLSIVDSKSGPVAGGFSYQTLRGDARGAKPKLARYDLGFGAEVSDALRVGVTAHHINGRYTRPATLERRKLSLFNADIGAMLVAQRLSLGIVYHNPFKTKRPDIFVPAWGAGLGLRGDVLSLAADLRVDQSEQSKGQTTWGGGAEYVVAGMLPLRAGYANRPEPGSREGLLSGGIAYRTDQGSLDLTYRRSLEDKSRWDLFGAFKIAM